MLKWQQGLSFEQLNVYYDEYKKDRPCCRNSYCNNLVSFHFRNTDGSYFNLCGKCFYEFDSGKYKCLCGDLATVMIVLDGEAEFFCYPCS